MKGKKQKIIKLQGLQANLKRRLRRHLSSVGFSKASNGSLQVSGSGKEIIRSLHHAQRNAGLKENGAFIGANGSSLLKYFASGNDISPERITPVLERIKSGTWQSDLFRLSSLTWSVPVSNGFGRRLRYLVWDAHNEKLIGLIAIGDPVFNLSVRDKLIGWDVHDRSDRLVNMMDAYVLGAVPPYNTLLGGKLVASLVRTRDIYDDFTRAYGNSEGIISGRQKKARLLAVTTSSALGRSSVYNRLKLGGVEYFKPIGFTGGWGHFHIPDELFSDLRAYLRDIGHGYADLHRFGHGPNWRLRTMRVALSSLGFREDMLKHGVQREVFICELASNAVSLLTKGKGRPNISSLKNAREVADLALQRWIIPRSLRRPEFRSWKASDVEALFGERRAPLRIISVK